jgi:pyruvate formate lyase activating enzyme
MKAPLIAISRHRIATDGVGVTTLVAFHGCPLACKYCLNPQCKRADGLWKRMSPKELLAEVSLDDIYFQATNGGICFGGGEPLLYSDFILQFAEIMPSEWNITVETSLNVPLEQLKTIEKAVSKYVIDIKDMDSDIYKRYTGKGNQQVIDNLKYLISKGIGSKACIRLPLIPNFNAEENRTKSEEQLREMGFDDFDKFKYFVKEG